MISFSQTRSFEHYGNTMYGDVYEMGVLRG